MMIILGVLFGLIVLLLLAGMIYESLASNRVKKQFPMAGEMIKVDGHKIHVKIMGDVKEGVPPVIIETGTGNWSYDWSFVQRDIAKYTQVMTYDRAGYGYSEPPTDPFTASNVVDDLHAIVEKKNIQKPFILIGHSAGGTYTRLYADKYPDSIAGMMLVDARNEKFAKRLPKFNKKFYETQDQTMNKLLARIGLIRLIGENFLPPNFPDKLSKEKYVSVHWDADFFKVLDQEIKQMSQSEEKLFHTGSLGDKPLTVITTRKHNINAEAFGFTKQEETKINQTWHKLQKDLTNLSSNSEFIVVENSSHAIMYDKPEVIVESVRGMIEEIMRKAHKKQVMMHSL